MLSEQEKTRVEKLLGMLGSEFDGERSNAARMLSKLATEHKLSLAELMRACFGGGASAKPQARWSSPRPDPGPDAAPSMLKMSRLLVLVGEKGTFCLTPWERDFAFDLLARVVTYLSDKQLAVVDRIINKLEKYVPADF